VSDASFPFDDPITGTECRVEISSGGVSHPGCPFLAHVSPELDCFYCAECGHNGRLSGAWWVDLMNEHEASS